MFMRACLTVVLFVVTTVAATGCIGGQKGKIVNAARVDEAVRAIEAENVQLEPIERDNEWILEGVRPVRHAIGDPAEELDLTLREQLSIYAFKSGAHRAAAFDDFHQQTMAVNMLYPRIYSHEEIMIFYWAAAANDEPSRFGEVLERAVNRLAGSAVYFNAGHAVARVLERHPEFPKAGETGSVKMQVGGPAPGLTVMGVTRTEVEREGQRNADAENAESDADACIVTLYKEWNAEIGGEKITSFWRYRVTRDTIELLDSVDEDWRLHTIK